MDFVVVQVLRAITATPALILAQVWFKLIIGSKLPVPFFPFARLRARTTACGIVAAPNLG